MKLLIFSDLHGSVEYLKKIIQIQKEQNIDKVLFLGDFFDYNNTKDEELICLLNSLSDKIIAVKGNCDVDYLLEELNFKVDNYYLLEIDNKRFFLTHIASMYDYLVDDDVIVICGHTHIPELSKKRLNPGSISRGRSSNKFTYIIYSNNCFNLYDINKGMLEYLKEE